MNGIPEINFFFYFPFNLDLNFLIQIRIIRKIIRNFFVCDIDFFWLIKLGIYIQKHTKWFWVDGTFVDSNEKGFCKVLFKIACKNLKSEKLIIPLHVHYSNFLWESSCRLCALYLPDLFLKDKAARTNSKKFFENFSFEKRLLSNIKYDDCHFCQSYTFYDFLIFIFPLMFNIFCCYTTVAC